MKIYVTEVNWLVSAVDLDGSITVRRNDQNVLLYTAQISGFARNPYVS